MAKQMTPAKVMYLQIGYKRFEIASFEEASLKFCMVRDRAGRGASQTPTPMIIDNGGGVIGHVSYNGRVWSGPVHSPKSELLYDNFLSSYEPEDGL